MKSEFRSWARSGSVAAAALLSVLSGACGGEAGTAEPSATDSVSQELSACTPRIQAIALATASSQQAAAFAPKYAIDGVATTRWSSDKGSEQSLLLDLGKVVNVAGLNINWQTAYSKSFTVDSSPDQLTWTPFITSAATKAGVQSVSGIAVTRYLRIHSSQATSWGNVSVIDVQVLGTLDATCANLLQGPWAFSSEDFEPPTFDASSVYSINGNSIAFTYIGKSFTLAGTVSGIHFKQPAPISQGGHYRLRLDVSNVSGASTTLFAASLSGAAGPSALVPIDGNGSGAIDFDVSAAPGSAPVIELIDKPLSAFPGVGLNNFTVKTTLTKTN